MKYANDLSLQLIILTIFLIFISGCPEAGLLSNYQTFTGKDELVLKEPRSDILNFVAEIGKTMGYKVSSLDRRNQEIGLTYESSMASVAMIGAYSHSRLLIKVVDGGKKLDISVMTIGNMGSGGQETAEKIVNEFKAKLSQRLG